MSGVGTAYPFGAPVFTLGFSVFHVTRSLFDEYVLLMFVCPCVLFLLAIVLPVLRYTDSDYPVGIFQLVLPIINVQSFNILFENKKAMSS